MPSIAAANAIAVALRLDRAIKATFDQETQKDVCRLVSLSTRGGDNIYILGTPIFGALCTAIGVFAYYEGTGDPFWSPLVAVTFVVLTPLLTYWFYRRRQNARRELKTLVALNPDYWNVLWGKLEPIILEAGNFKDSLLPQQVTRIVH